MGTLVLLTLTGLGLAALYFLVASGLSLVRPGRRLTRARVFLGVGAYATWWAAEPARAGWPAWLGAVAFGVAAGAVVAMLVELVLIRPLYSRTIEQVLVTVGLSLAGVALLQATWGADARPFPRPEWTRQVTGVLGAKVPNAGLLLIIAAAVVLGALLAFLRWTHWPSERPGWRTGRWSALGIDCGRRSPWSSRSAGPPPRWPGRSVGSTSAPSRPARVAHC
jgi:branched-chain amino acid transport system permease protein